MQSNIKKRYSYLLKEVSDDVAAQDVSRIAHGEDDQGAGIRTADIEFPSWDGVSSIHGTIWYPKDEPKGIVQLIHGMSEHISRYDHFARYLAGNGFAVCGHDHIGHGYSASSPEDLGHMPPDNGADILVEDVDTLRHIAQDAFPAGIPYFIFGHSMGSFTLRVYLTRHGEGLSGAIVCGTGNEPVVLSLTGNALAKLGSLIRGETSRSNFIHSLADGAFVRQVEDPQTEFDWISYDRDNINDFIADDLNGFQFTLGGYAALTRLAYLASNLDLAKQIPARVPIFFVSGAEDPVGNKGEGVKEAAELMVAAGIDDVEVILYENMRHEILNEAAAGAVYADILDWIDRHMHP